MTRDQANWLWQRKTWSVFEMQADAMRELVSPAQSETLVLVFSLLALLVGAFCGWKTLGVRGAALLGGAGLLIYPLWRFHSYITRYDPQTGYFGLDKVRVLATEAVIFVVLGAALGFAWNKMAAQREDEIAKGERKFTETEVRES